MVTPDMDFPIIRSATHRSNCIRLVSAISTAFPNDTKPQLAFLPMETVMHDRQAQYYQALASSDQAADAAPFSEFILQSLLDAILAAAGSDPVSDPVAKLLAALKPNERLATEELMRRPGLKHITYFRRNYLKPALAAGRIRMTQPDSPNSPTQRYALGISTIHDLIRPWLQTCDIPPTRALPPGIPADEKFRLSSARRPREPARWRQ